MLKICFVTEKSEIEKIEKFIPENVAIYYMLEEDSKYIHGRFFVYAEDRPDFLNFVLSLGKFEVNIIFTHNVNNQ